MSLINVSIEVPQAELDAMLYLAVLAAVAPWFSSGSLATLSDFVAAPSSTLLHLRNDTRSATFNSLQLVQARWSNVSLSSYGYVDSLPCDGTPSPPPPLPPGPGPGLSLVWSTEDLGRTLDSPEGLAAPSLLLAIGADVNASASPSHNVTTDIVLFPTTSSFLSIDRPAALPNGQVIDSAILNDPFTTGPVVDLTHLNVRLDGPHNSVYLLNLTVVDSGDSPLAFSAFSEGTQRLNNATRVHLCNVTVIMPPTAFLSLLQLLGHASSELPLNGSSVSKLKPSSLQTSDRAVHLGQLWFAGVYGEVGET